MIIIISRNQKEKKEKKNHTKDRLDSPVPRPGIHPFTAAPQRIGGGDTVGVVSGVIMAVVVGPFILVIGVLDL